MSVFVRTVFSPRVRYPANPGCRLRPVFTAQFDADGVMDLIQTGEEDLYDFIQSHKESVDIHVILDRYRRGDINALSRVQGAYGDFTTVPKTYAEALNALIAAENYFNGLPVETRAKFGHSFQQFLASMDKPGFTQAMGFQPAEPVGGNVVQFPSGNMASPSTTNSEGAPSPEPAPKAE